jgi:hypothetical protein
MKGDVPEIEWLREVPTHWEVCSTQSVKNGLVAQLG